jgi:hypothetical protein
VHRFSQKPCRNVGWSCIGCSCACCCIFSRHQGPVLFGLDTVHFLLILHGLSVFMKCPICIYELGRTDSFVANDLAVGTWQSGCQLVFLLQMSSRCDLQSQVHRSRQLCALVRVLRLCLLLLALQFVVTPLEPTHLHIELLRYLQFFIETPIFSSCL